MKLFSTGLNKDEYIRSMVFAIIIAVAFMATVILILCLGLRSAKEQIAAKDAQIQTQEEIIDELETQIDVAYAQLAEWATADTPVTPEAVTESAEQSAVVYAAPKQDAPAGLRSLGTFKVTHYCCCDICCGNTAGITASGRAAVAGYSIAVDPKVIPLGSAVWLDYGDGAMHEYRADDTGGAVKGAVIDVCCVDHDTALSLGRRSATVYVQEVLK